MTGWSCQRGRPHEVRKPRRLELLEETARLRALDLAAELERGADPAVRRMRESAHFAGMEHISTLLVTELHRVAQGQEVA